MKGLCAAAAPFWGMNFLRLMWVSIAYAIMQFGITAIVYFNPLIVGEPQPLYVFMSSTIVRHACLFMQDLFLAQLNSPLCLVQ